VTLESVIQATWALTLRSYLGSDSTLFGFEKDKICGSKFAMTYTVVQHLERAAESSDADDSAPSWWSVKGNHIGNDLFNSVLVTSGQSSTEEGSDSRVVRVKNNLKDRADCFQLDLLVEYVREEKSTFQITHIMSFLDAAQGQRIAKTARNILVNIVSELSMSIGNLNVIDEEDSEQIWAWNSSTPEDPQQCAHNLLEKQA
jgi:hypothetical protein